MRTAPLLAGALLAVVGLTGCTNAQPPAAATSARDSAVAFAQCMRENGVDMPDPGADGRIRVDPGAGVDQAALDDAQAECSHLLGAGPADTAGSFGEEEKQRLLDFAECLRDHGFPDFPDPEFGDGGQVMLGGDGIDPADPAFQEASQVCETEVGLPAPGGDE